MKIAVFQFYPQFDQKEDNLSRIEDAVQKMDADLVVLPEFCTTGYQFAALDEVNRLSEPIPKGEATERFAWICSEKKIFLVAGLAEKEKGIYFNSAVLVGPDGYIGTYRKIHLYDQEKKWFTPGDLGFQVWNIGIAKIGIMICFDWIFPEAARSLAMRGAEIICHPANLVLPWCQNAMITRSIENRVFTITSNRIGSEERSNHRLVFTGQSQAVNPKGELLFRMGQGEEGCRVVEIDPGLAQEKWVTLNNHLWQDRRPEWYDLYKK